LLYTAINDARTAGIIFVAASGNNGNDNDRNDTSHVPLYPASYDLDNIIAVAATTRSDERWINSNFGATRVDLGTGGLEIYSSWNRNDTDYYETRGTSQAAAYVSGACALVWAKYPGEPYTTIINRILTAVDPLPSLAGKCKTGGRLNLYRALLPNGNGLWAGTGSLETGRYGHTATLLADEKVLVTGGWNNIDLRSVELYNPTPPGTWTTGTEMNAARFQHTATLLRNGKVLVTGGTGAFPNAEVYDPAPPGTWTAAHRSGQSRTAHTATLLLNGKVLVAGGLESTYLRSADLYDPAT
jgi:subtilisin family serine protease